MSTAAEHLDQPVLLREDRDGLTTLTLNRPAAFNCLSEALLDALGAALDDIRDDPSVRVVVIAGAGKAFCAGHDLKEMRANRSQDYYRDLFARCGALMQGIVALPKPVIARVHGAAAAAGCQLVATCDMAVSSTAARFGVSGVKLGLFCSTPSVALSRNVSRKRAFKMLVTGDLIDAGTAVDFGLVNEAVAPEELDAAIQRLADSIRAKSPVAVETGKRMFYRQVEKELAEAYAYAGEVMSCNMMADDVVEGVDAFFEKREPQWSGH